MTRIETWLNEGFVYAGWIPCVSGNLVFQHCKETNLRTLTRPECAVNKIFGGRRYLSSLTTRNTRDFGSDDGLFNFSVIMDFDLLDNEIEGCIHITPEKNEARRTRKQGVTLLDKFKKACGDKKLLDSEELAQYWSNFKKEFEVGEKSSGRIFSQLQIVSRWPCGF